MTQALSWILISWTLAIGGSEQHSALGIADQHQNVAKGKTIYRSDVQDIIYDQKHLVDGKDTTTSYLYFPRSLTICIDLGDSYTVRHVVIKISPESFHEMKAVTAKLSYAHQPDLPTLTHEFRSNECLKTKKHENNFFIVTLYRCCGPCCGWKLRGIGRFLNVTFEKKWESTKAFGVHEVEVRGLKSPSGLNLALFKPVLDEHKTPCKMRPFVVNDAWMDELFVQVKQPPFRWRVDLGKAQKLGYVRFVYKGKWGLTKLILMSDEGEEHADDSCPLVRTEDQQKNTICCNTERIDVATRWLEIRGERSLPQLVEVFVYPRGFKLLLDECPKRIPSPNTTVIPSTTTSITTETSTSRRSLHVPLNETVGYSTITNSPARRLMCDCFTISAFIFFSSILAI